MSARVAGQMWLLGRAPALVDPGPDAAPAGARAPREVVREASRLAAVGRCIVCRRPVPTANGVRLADLKAECHAGICAARVAAARGVGARDRRSVLARIAVAFWIEESE